MSKWPVNQDSLRTAAEEKLARAHAPKQKPPSAEKLLHELRVHQVQLEMQNETLRQSQIELEISRDRYMDFYDFSPVGYLTLSHKALIPKSTSPVPRCWEMSAAICAAAVSPSFLLSKTMISGIGTSWPRGNMKAN